MVKVNLYLPDQIAAFIREQAQARGISFSEMARRVMERGYLGSMQELREVSVHTHNEPRGPEGRTEGA